VSGPGKEPDGWQTVKVLELRLVCADRGLDDTGLKADLILRLRASDRSRTGRLTGKYEARKIANEAERNLVGAEFDDERAGRGYVIVSGGWCDKHGRIVFFREPTDGLDKAPWDNFGFTYGYVMARVEAKAAVLKAAARAARAAREGAHVAARGVEGGSGSGDGAGSGAESADAESGDDEQTAWDFLGSAAVELRPRRGTARVASDPILSLGDHVESDSEAEEMVLSGTEPGSESGKPVATKHEKFINDHPMGKVRKDTAVRHEFSSKRDKKSNDRLKRVCGLVKAGTDNSDHSHVELIDSEHAALQLDVPFAALGIKAGSTVMVVCTVERLQLDGKPVSALSSGGVASAGARVVGRVMTMVASDSKLQWKLGAYGDTCEWPAADVQPLCIEPSVNEDAGFAFPISELTEVAAALYGAHSGGAPGELPALHGTKVPYCSEGDGPLFVVATANAPLGVSSMVTCGVCSSSIPLGKMQLHTGHHIAHGHANLAADPCGFCGVRAASHCATKVVSSSGNRSQKVETSCPLLANSTGVYQHLAHMKKISRPQPCTNHPVKCTAAGGSAGGACHGFTWSHTVKQHFGGVHGGAAVAAAMQSEVSNQEQVWVKFAGPKGKEVPSRWNPEKPNSWTK
jgi:hypothetical protein